METSDTPQNEETTPTPSDSILITLPTVLCTDITDDPSLPESNSMVTSESKLSLPSFGSSTSPLRITSPVSLPTSPTPFSKVPLQICANKSLDDPSQLSEQKQSATTMNSPLIDTGSATGNPRNKCALQPGHSLMDWIRLGNSGKDLTGVGGHTQPVTRAELARHTTENDAWLAIDNKVYNITHYLPYHPGGPEELMKGAGTDATHLFNGVHSWVNYDSLLGKCFIGPLQYDLSDKKERNISKSDRLKEPSKAQDLVRKSMENLANCITPVKKKIISKSEENVKGSPPSKIMQSLIQSSDLPVSISRKAASSSNEVKMPFVLGQLRFDWIQTRRNLGFFIYTGSEANTNACARYSDNTLFVDILIEGWISTFKVVLEGGLKEPIKLRIYYCSGRLEVIAFKTMAKLWKTLVESSFSYPIQVTSPRFHECKVIHAERISRDTTLLVMTPGSASVIMAVGYHIKVHHKDKDKEIVRSYTPLGDGWVDNYEGNGFYMKLAIKRYEIGALSPHLSGLSVGDTITISGYYGDFDIRKMCRTKVMYLLAAGTGITPMLSVLKFVLAKTDPRCKLVSLMYFNKREEDILFKEQFDKLASEDERFKVVHVLSNASSSWTGLKGRISRDILLDVIDDNILLEDDLPHFVCMCGPRQFNRVGLDLLIKLGINRSDIHVFA